MVVIRDREVKICRRTGNRVVMEYVGYDDNSKNGHPGWLCLHEDTEDADEGAVKQFLLDQENR